MVLGAGGAWASTVLDDTTDRDGDVPLADGGAAAGDPRPSRGGDARQALPGGTGAPSASTTSQAPDKSSEQEGGERTSPRPKAQSSPSGQPGSADPTSDVPGTGQSSGAGATPPSSSEPEGATSADTQAPQTRIVSGPADNEPSVFAFAASETATFACSLDGAGFESCGSSLRLTDLDAGWHTMRVRASDSAGNTDPTPATWRWHTSAADQG